MKRYVLFLLLATLLNSCVQDSTNDILVNVDAGDRIYATLDSADDRVELNGSNQLVWTAADEMVVVYTNIRNRYKFDGKTGDKSASFTRIKVGTPVANYEFDRFYAVCPYGTSKVASNGVFVFVSPTTGTSTQEYVSADRLSVNTNMAFGVSDDGADFSFKGVLGYLQVKLTGDKVVKSIELINNSGAKLAGQYFVYINNPDEVNLYQSQNATTNIILDCGDGVQLSDTPTDFYFAIRPMELTEGVTLNVTFTDGSTFVQSTSKAITITRNTIQPMAVIPTSGVVYQIVNITHSMSSFTLPTITGKTSLSGCTDFGDGTTSLLNFVTSYDYTDGKEMHTVTMKLRNATKIEIGDCRGISEIDLSNF